MADWNGKNLGNYHLERRIGSGGYAEVYLAHHRYLHTPVALKLLHASLESDDLERFLREAQLLASLIHPHIVRILDFGVEQETAFLVMDYALHGSCAERYPAGQPLPLEQIVSPVQQVASALDYAHAAHRIHRDVKPDNFLLGRQQEVWLSDFGIAVLAGDRFRPGEGAIAGTAAYAAPEQVQGQPVPASDQYSLGVVVYEWMTGTLPFVGTPLEMAAQHVLKTPPRLREHVPTLSTELEAVVLRALEKDPHARFANVGAFAQALTEISQAAEKQTSAASSASGMPAFFVPGMAGNQSPLTSSAAQEGTAAGDAEAVSADGTRTTRSQGAMSQRRTDQRAGQGSPFVRLDSRLRRRRRTVLAACLGVLVLLITSLVMGGLAFQGGGSASSLAHSIDTGQRQPTSVATPVGTVLVPTTPPTMPPTPLPPGPTRPPSTPTLSPTATSARFSIAPTSSAQTCANNGTKLAAITITLDNTAGSASIPWQISITQTDASGNLWATGTPDNGTVDAGKTATLQITPEKHLCRQQSTTTFRATIIYQTTSGSQMISFTDVVTITG